jgi:hypothetical protein
MTQPSTRRHVALATLVLVTMAAAACGHSSPVAPEAAASGSEAAIAPTATLAAKPGSSTTTGAVATFPLSEGTFTIANRKAGQVSGTYRGETTDTNGVSVTKLRLDVISGTGAFAGATGVLEGNGRGAFTGAGAFSLKVSGFVSTDGKKKAKFSASIQGSSQVLPCDGGKLIVSLSSDGTKSRSTLQHTVGNAGCF